MKTSLRPASLAVLLLALTGPLAAQSLDYDGFVQALDQAVRLNDERGMQRLVKNNTHHAVAHFRALIRVDLAKGETSAHRKPLRAAWQATFGSSAALDRIERWAGSLYADGWKVYDRGHSDLNKAYGAKADLLSNPKANRAQFEQVALACMKIAENFEAVGAAIAAADAWALCSEMWSKCPERTLDDRREAVRAMEQFVRLRESWEYTGDDLFKAWVSWMKSEKERIESDAGEAEQREAAGYDKNVRGAEAYLMPNADETEIVAPLEFEVLKDLPLDMCPQGGPVPVLWANVDVAGTGPAKLPWFRRVDLFMVRPANNKWGVTLEGGEPDLKKNPFTPVTASNRLKEPAQFALALDGSHPYAMWFWTAGAQETFQGMSQNLAPQRDYGKVYYKSAASWRATVNDVDVVLLDDNSNGQLFESDPYEYGMTDRTIGDLDEEVKIPAFDSMRIGKGPEQPWSQWAKIGDAWYHLRGQAGGEQLGVRVTNPEYFHTGSIVFKWLGPKPSAPSVVIVQGSGDFATARFNIAAGKPVEVPVGDYTLQYGRIVSGKGARMITADLFPGRSEKVTVEKGATTTLSLGAPFVLDFRKGGDDAKVEINSHTFKVYGTSGELYTHVNGATPEPEVLMSRDESGRGAKTIGEFVAITDPEIASAVAKKAPRLGFFVGFYPVIKGDAAGNPVLEVEIDEGSKIGLREKKNKLFGKLDPVWK